MAHKEERKAVFLLMAVILIAGLFLRMYNISWETYGYGEIELKEAADEYAKGNFINNFYLFDNPPLGKYFFTASILIFGESEVSFRIVSLFFGMLTIISIFFLARKMYDVKTALFASSITAFSILQIEFSRYTQIETLLSFLYVIVIYFLWETIEENKKYSFACLGAAIGLAFATKFTAIILLAAVIIYTLYIKHVKISIRPSFSIVIKNWILKALIIAIVAFFIAWPFSLSRLHTTANISVDYGGTVRSQNVDANVPIAVLSFARRVFTSISDDIGYPLAMKLPVVNYFLLFLVKESAIILPLLAAGAYFMIKKPMKPDKLIFIIIITFLVMLAFQRTNITYRHMTPLMPFLSIVAARWIYGFKNHFRQAVCILLVSFVMFSYAFLSNPSYALSYNPLKDVLGIGESEGRFSEGMKDTLSYVKENCSSVFTSNNYRVMTEPYFKNVSSDHGSMADCVIKGRVYERFDVSSYIQEKNCTVSMTVSKNSIELIDTYRCDYSKTAK